MKHLNILDLWESLPHPFLGRPVCALSSTANRFATRCYFLKASWRPWAAVYSTRHDPLLCPIFIMPLQKLNIYLFILDSKLCAPKYLNSWSVLVDLLAFVLCVHELCDYAVVYSLMCREIRSRSSLIVP